LRYIPEIFAITSLDGFQGRQGIYGQELVCR